MSDEGSYIYSPLEHNYDAIRLVKIRGIDEEGFLSVSLENTIIQRESYAALSYVWGDEPAVYKIKVNGCLFHIRPNLWSFLITCNLEGKLLWVDALCIDQHNVLEKNRQVPLMGRIFSQASKVICWLHGGMLTATLSDCNRRWINTLQHRDFNDNADLIAHDLLRLSHHPYWSRLWIVQELQLGQMIEVLWEGHKLSGKRLAYILDTGLLEQTGVLRAAEMQNPEGSLMLRSLLARRDTFHLRQTHQADLFTLVLKYGNLLGSLRHDRVYALVALATDGATFMVDYTESRTTLLARLLHHCKNLPDWEDILEVSQSLGIESEQPIFEILSICAQSNAASQLQAENIFERCTHCFHQRVAGEYPDLIIGIPNVLYFGLTNSYTMFGPSLLRRQESRAVSAGIAHRYSVSAVLDTDRCQSVFTTGELHHDDFTLLKKPLSHFTFAALGGNTNLAFIGTTSDLLELLTGTRRVNALWRSCRWITCSETDLESGGEKICKRLSESHRVIVEVDTDGAANVSQPNPRSIPRLVKWKESLVSQGGSSLLHFILIENKEVKTWEEVKSIMEEYHLLHARIFSAKNSFSRSRKQDSYHVSKRSPQRISHDTENGGSQDQAKIHYLGDDHLI